MINRSHTADYLIVGPTCIPVRRKQDRRDRRVIILRRSLSHRKRRHLWSASGPKTRGLPIITYDPLSPKSDRTTMKTERKSASSLSTRIEEKDEKRRALDGIRGLRRTLARSQILLLVPLHRSQSTRPCFPSFSLLRYTPWPKFAIWIRSKK